MTKISNSKMFLYPALLLTTHFSPHLLFLYTTYFLLVTYQEIENFREEAQLHQIEETYIIEEFYDQIYPNIIKRTRTVRWICVIYSIYCLLSPMIPFIFSY